MSKPGIISSSFSPAQESDILPFQLGFWGLAALGFAVSNSQADGKKNPTITIPQHETSG